MHSIVRPLLCAMLVTLAACSDQELTRGKAADLLRERSELKDTALYPQDSVAMVKCGMEQELWNEPRNAMQGGPVTQLGRELGVDSVARSFGGGWFVKMKTPVGVSNVRVTGIKDAPVPLDSGTYKVVEFEYNYDAPDPLANCLGERKGEALFALYDDGWRVEDL